MIGWDIGGVNTKVARVVGKAVARSCCHPYELQRDPGLLAPTLRYLAEVVGAELGDRHAVTMTAELSQIFRLKRDGVNCVLDAVEAAFPESCIYVLDVAGRFILPVQARRAPLSVAASNWVATAMLVAEMVSDCILIDIGTTTTDIIPIAGNKVCAMGRNDPERLLNGELVYTGAVRTPVEAVVRAVPLAGGLSGVSAEGFALMGDVHLWRGDLAPEHYTVPTPDGRPAARRFAGERLARVVCGDRELLDEAAIDAIAAAAAATQVQQVGAALARVQARWPGTARAVTAGVGEFIALRAGRAAGLAVAPLAERLGADAARGAPAAAVALLAAAALAGGAA